jgi:enterochelin esterase family protein
LLETHPWKPGPVQQYDRRVAAGDAPPAILVMPDAFTCLGGSQYVNGPLVGNYRDYVARELTAFVDEHYPTRPGRRAVVGKSSGGFGALHLGMHHPDVFPVVASIAGDCRFESCYGPDFLNALRGLQDHGGDPDAFLEAFAEKPDLSGDGHALINLLAMSACYSPSARSPRGFDIPVDLETGELIESVWQRWLAFDPVRACREHADALGRLELLYLEAGRRDEFHMQFGLRVLVRVLRDLGVAFEHEEFEGGHFGLNERVVRLLPRLVDALGHPGT